MRKNDNLNHYVFGFPPSAVKFLEESEPTAMDEEKIIDEIVTTVVSFLKPKKVILFGSRANRTNGDGDFAGGRMNEYSDFDIAVENAEMDIRRERILKEALDKKLGIYMVDVVSLDRVDSDFKNLILKTGKVLYEA